MIRLKYERVRLGLSQSALAIAARLDQSMFRQVELGRYIPGPVALGRLAEVLGLPSDVDLLRPVEIVKPEERPRDTTTGRYVKVQR